MHFIKGPKLAKQQNFKKIISIVAICKKVTVHLSLFLHVAQLSWENSLPVSFPFLIYLYGIQGFFLPFDFKGFFLNLLGIKNTSLILGYGTHFGAFQLFLNTYALEKYVFYVNFCPVN